MVSLCDQTDLVLRKVAAHGDRYLSGICDEEFAIIRRGELKSRRRRSVPTELMKLLNDAAPVFFSEIFRLLSDESTVEHFTGSRQMSLNTKFGQPPK